MYRVYGLGLRVAGFPKFGVPFPVAIGVRQEFLGGF